MSRYEIPVVFNTEVEPPEPLGIYVRTDEDVVFYRSGARVTYAPQDCVKVATCVVKVP
jgi:hypothetical protein